MVNLRRSWSRLHPLHLFIFFAFTFVAIVAAVESPALATRDLLPVGAACSDDSQCSTLRCDADNQNEPFNCKRQLAGQPCLSNDGCSTRNCLIPAGASTGVCKVSENGESCDVNYDCRSYGCSLSTGKCLITAGNACTVAADCASKRCCNGKCLPNFSLSACRQDATCASGKCDLTPVTQWSTLRHEYKAGQCKFMNAPDGTLCVYAGHCQSGVCSRVGWIYYGMPTTVGLCGPPTDAAQNFTCLGQPLAAGAGPCATTGECVTGICPGGQVHSWYRRGAGRREHASSSHGHLNALAHLRAAEPPRLHAERDGQDFICQKADVGGRCLTKADCLKGWCDNGKFCALTPNQKPCTLSQDCVSQFCNPRTNTCTLNSGLGDTCETHDDCNAGGCLKGKCTMLPVNQGCSTDAQCSDSQTGVQKQQLCTLVPVGGVCTAPANCGSNRCGADQRCVASSVGGACNNLMDCEGYASCTPAGTCLGRAGASCVAGSGDSMCESGKCDPAKGQCTPAPVGSGCRADADCLSLRCGPSKTTACDPVSSGDCITYTACDPNAAVGGACADIGGLCSKASATDAAGLCTIPPPPPPPKTTTTTSTTTTSTTTTEPPLLPLDHKCKADGRCASGYCRRRLLPDETRSPDVTCAAKKGLGEKCYSNYGCLSGECGDVSERCVASPETVTFTTSSLSTTTTTSRPRSTSTSTSTSSRRRSTMSTSSTRRTTSTSSSTRRTSTTSSRRTSTATTSTRTLTGTLRASASCTKNAQCRSGYCYRALIDKVKEERATVGACQAKGERGAKCYQKAGCVSGQCVSKRCT